MHPINQTLMVALKKRKLRRRRLCPKKDRCLQSNMKLWAQIYYRAKYNALPNYVNKFLNK